MKYKVHPCSYGYGLFAQTRIEPGEVLDRFEGYETAYEKLNEEEKRLAIYLGFGRCFVITNSLVNANHACDANCRIEGDDLVAVRGIEPSEQLTFNYNLFPLSRRDDPEEDWWWDPRWTFNCQCGSDRCQGLIDGYRFR